MMIPEVFFGINYRVQFAAICFYIVILASYVTRKKLPMRSTRCFSGMLTVVGINLICDVATVYTITHINYVPSWINRLVHQMFLATLDLTVFFLLLYIKAIAKNQTKLSPLGRVVGYVPITVALLYTVFGELNYFVEGNKVYSYGPMADALKVILVFYIVAIAVDTFRYRHLLKRRTILSIYSALAIWIILSSLQIIRKDLLITSVTSTIMLLFIYLAFENPTENLDASTGMFNQKAFEAMCTENITKHNQFYLIYIKIMDYNLIGNQYGHAMVCELLTNVGEWLSSTSDGRVFRTSNSCIAIISRLGKDKTDALIQKIDKRFFEPWEFGGSKIHLNVDADVMDVPGRGLSLDELFEMLRYLSDNEHRADTKTHVRYVDERLIALKDRHVTILKILKDAIANDGFEVFYQPIFSVSHGMFISAEALVRLKDKTTIGFIPPDEFIPIAEKNGLIMEVSACVFTSVCKFINEHRPDKFGVKYIEFNISGIEGVDAQLPAQLGAIMEQYGVAPNFINIEITETAVVESGERLMENMQKLKEMGCSFSMDDFGTGYSNLATLTSIPYDLMKIDKSLIWPCFEKNGDKSKLMLTEVVRMICGMGGQIVAEGVETKEMVEMLTEMGVEYLQGYYFSRPVPHADFLAYIQDKNVCSAVTAE